MTNKASMDLSPDNVARAVMLLYGKTAESQPFWCFAAVKPTRRQELVERVKAKTFEIARYVEDGYGEIVVSGEGVFPPRDVIKAVAGMFNVPIRQLFADVDMDAVIAKEIEKLKKELGEA